MARLNIKTKLNRVFVCGDFCDWELMESIEGNRKGDAKYITIDKMPEGEYSVFSCPSYMSREVYPKDNRAMCNRYFNGEESETIYSYFD